MIGLSRSHPTKDSNTREIDQRGNGCSGCHEIADVHGQRINGSGEGRQDSRVFEISLRGVPSHFSQSDFVACPFDGMPKVVVVLCADCILCEQPFRTIVFTFRVSAHRLRSAQCRLRPTNFELESRGFEQDDWTALLHDRAGLDTSGNDATLGLGGHDRATKGADRTRHTICGVESGEPDRLGSNAKPRDRRLEGPHPGAIFAGRLRVATGRLQQRECNGNHQDRPYRPQARPCPFVNRVHQTFSERARSPWARNF